MVGAVIEQGAALRDCHAFRIIAACNHIACRAGLAQHIAAPEMAGFCRCSPIRLDDSQPPSHAIVAEGGGLTGIVLVADGEQSVLGIPLIGPDSVILQIAIGVVNEAFVVEARELVNGVVMRHRTIEGSEVVSCVIAIAEASPG